uniref:Secreted protein n=1 Tax=Caenorhabditis japonica TaxID=281687 RepID=A0A8R1IJN8_CAEJA
MTLAIIIFFLFLFTIPYSDTLQCINSTSYMDRMLVKPQSTTCQSGNALCVKTMQISQDLDGSPNVLSIHRECLEVRPPPGNVQGGHGCVDSYDEDNSTSHRL